jgi:DNA-binding transcriptional ArsR family regulator
MTKITLDRDTFKALASDTRLEILRVLDGKKLSLNDLMRQTTLNKATLHEHLSKLNDAGLVTRQEREGHKWVYYRLTWKGESLLHPENTRIVVLFTTTFIALWVGILQLIWYVKGTITNIRYDVLTAGKDTILADSWGLNSYHAIAQENLGGLHSGLPTQLQTIMNFLRNKPLSNQGPLSFSYENDLMKSYAPTAGGLESSLPPNTRFVMDTSQDVLHAVYQNPMFLYIAVGCFALFTVVLCIAVWRLWENRIPKL